MKRYQINEVEFKYLKEVLEYLNQDDAKMSDDGTQRINEILSRIHSRPVLDVILDTKAIDEATKQLKEDTNV